MFLKKHLTKVLLLILLFSGSLNLVAQKQKPKNSQQYDDKFLHFGFSIGFNTFDFKTKISEEAYAKDRLYPELSFLQPGFNIQVIIDFKPLTHFDIRFLPGVAFGQRDLIYYKDQVLYNDQQKIPSSFLEFPLLLKTKGDRLNNIRPYIVGGLNLRYDLAGQKKYDDSLPIYIRLRRTDLYFEIGAGLDIYLPYFKLAIEFKMSTGLRDVLVHDPADGNQQYVNAIESLKSQIWVLAFHFE